jgi:hypothetical protein
MTISQLITALQAIQQEHGDLEVDTTGFDCRRTSQQAPEIAYRKVLQGRESRPAFFHKLDGESRRGDKVVRL